MVLVGALSPAGATAQSRDTVAISTGSLAGLIDEGIREFRGIPYAAPPVGELRWKPPQSPSPWHGVRAADSFAPGCMQTPPGEGTFYQVEFYPEPRPTSEDCLYLNVWTPTDVPASGLPVMLWIHGGGFTQGSGAMPTFDGSALARKGVVVVTFNYRLGVFGLLAHPELSAESPHGGSGNYGLFDHLAALKWIRDEIDAFGGDPGNVTIFGQSSGADNVNILLASPLAAGLFHRAILQSGSVFAFGRKSDLAAGERAGAELADSLADGTITRLRSLPADSLLEASRAFRVRPYVDGWLLPDYVDRVFERGEQHDVPIVVGSTADEGTALVGPGLTAERFRQLVTDSYGDDADRFSDLYPARSDEEAYESFNASFSDRLAWGAQALAEAHRGHASSPTWVYLFAHPPPGRNQERYGAFHSSDIVYVFGSFDGVDRPWRPEDREVSELVTSYWTRFARVGNPNGPRLPDWPEFGSADRRALRITVPARSGEVLDEERRRFFRSRWLRED